MTITYSRTPSPAPLRTESDFPLDMAGLCRVVECVATSVQVIIDG